jgi:hypothetical protein
VRFVQRNDGLAATVYRRQADNEGRDRLMCIAKINPLGVRSATGLLRQAVADSAGRHARARKPIAVGPCRPLDAEWGPRVACYAVVVAGLRDPERLMNAARHLQRSSSDEAAWWLGLMDYGRNRRAVRALRILTEAVE